MSFRSKELSSGELWWHSFDENRVVCAVSPCRFPVSGGCWYFSRFPTAAPRTENAKDWTTLNCRLMCLLFFVGISWRVLVTSNWKRDWRGAFSYPMDLRVLCTRRVNRKCAFVFLVFRHVLVQSSNYYLVEVLHRPPRTWMAFSCFHRLYVKLHAYKWKKLGHERCLVLYRAFCWFAKVTDRVVFEYYGYRCWIFL